MSRSSQPTFDHLFLLGRPAGGKSEFIEFMRHVPDDRRITRYHIAPFDVIDDFVFLWEKFEEDDLWERVNYRRLHSRKVGLEGENYIVAHDYIWPFLIEKLNLIVQKQYLATPDYYRDHSLLIEFARGGPVGYRESLERFDPAVLHRAAILYIQVSFAEACRRNKARYDRAHRDGILTHTVPEDEMERMYAHDDWDEITSGPRGYLQIRGLAVPYVTMLNEPESTDPDVLDARYHEALEALWQLYSQRISP